MVTGFEPLFDRLVYIRHLGMMRPAIPEPVDPIKCWLSIYFVLNSDNEVVYATDIKPTHRTTPDGNKFNFIDLAGVATF